MKAAKRAEHLTLLPGGAWALWRGAALRGAGFPASLLQKLASPAAAAAADQVLDGGSGPGFKATYEAEVSRIAGEIRRLAGWERFREAVAWQNYRVVERSLDRLARATPEESSSRNFQQRRDEMTVALYLQRYCAKNDTIGFFGPVGWARLDDEGDLASVRPGSRFLAQRQVYFENWAIDALAAKLAEDPEIRPWLTPRLKTGLAIDGEQLRRPGGVATPLSPFDAQLRRACDGTRTAASWRRNSPRKTPSLAWRPCARAARSTGPWRSRWSSTRSARCAARSNGSPPRNRAGERWPLSTSSRTDGRRWPAPPATPKRCGTGCASSRRSSRGAPGLPPSTTRA